MEKAIILPTKERLIEKLDTYTKTEAEFDPSEFTGLYELLTPILSLDGHGTALFETPELSQYKKINIYQHAHIDGMNKEIYHKVHEFTNSNESLLENKVINLIVKYGNFSQTEFYKGPDIMSNSKKLFVNNQKNFVDMFFNPLDFGKSSDVVTYKIFCDIFFKYIRTLQENNLLDLYGDMFKDVIDYYFTIKESTINFNKIPLIDAYFLNNSEIGDLNVYFYEWNDTHIDEYLKIRKAELEKIEKTYVPTILISDGLSVKQVIDLIVNNCTNLNFGEELYHLYLKTKNKIFIKIWLSFDKYYETNHALQHVSKIYRQLKYKPIKTHADIIYNIKLMKNTLWFSTWDFVYLNIIHSEYQSNKYFFSELFLSLYFGNFIINESEHYKGININNYIPVNITPLKKEALEVNELIRSKRIFFHNVEILRLGFDTIFGLDDDYFNVFADFLVKEVGTHDLPADVSHVPTDVFVLDLSKKFNHMLELLRDGKISFETACKVWSFCYINYFSTFGQAIQYSLNIFKILSLFVGKDKPNINEDIKNFVNWLIIHNDSYQIKYINYVIPESLVKTNIHEIFYSFPIVNLLDRFMNSNNITKNKAIELELIKMTFESGWVEGFVKTISKLGGINELKILIRDGVCNPNDLNISDDMFNDFIDLIFDAFKKFEHKADVKTIFRPYILKFIESKITFIDDDDEEKIINLIDRYINVLNFYNEKMVGGKPLVSAADIRKFWEIKDKQLNIIHLAAATGSVRLLEHLLITANSSVKISFASETDNGRNILFYIKNIDQLDLILRLPGLNPERLATMFYKVDTHGKSVFYTWITKESGIAKELFERVLPRLPVPLNYTIETVIPGFTKTITNQLIDNPIDNMKTLIPLFETYNLVNSEDIKLSFIISKNINKAALTPLDIEELKLVLAYGKINDLLTICINKNYDNTLNNLADLDTSNTTILYTVNNIIKNIDTITSIKPGIYLTDIGGKKVIEFLLPYIYKNSYLLNDIISFLETMKKSGKNEEIKQIKFLPGLLEIPTSINYSANKTHLQNCFSFTFFIIRNYVSDDEINKVITLKSGNYKPIHELCGFGRSHTWRNVGGYLNLYYYLYGKTTPMPDFVMPSGYDIIKPQIQVASFVENDFDMDLIPDSADKVNIPVFDHYLTLPTDIELADNQYAYTYEHKNIFNTPLTNSSNNWVHMNSQVINSGTEKKTNPDGSVAEGIFSSDGKLIEGKITFPYGTIKEGIFSSDGKLIKGKITFSNGTIQEGEFSDNLLIKGKITIPNKNVIKDFDAIKIEGSFDDDKLNGKITYQSGIIEEGEFNLLKLTKGKVTSPDGKVTYIDKEIKETNDTKPVEEVKKHETKTLPDGTIEEGLFSDSGELIKGKKTYSHGMIVEGEFYRNHIIKGKIISPIAGYEGTNGILIKETFIIEEGDFDEYGIITGKITYPDGTIEEGNFKEQTLIKGKKISPDGTIRNI